MNEQGDTKGDEESFSLSRTGGVELRITTYMTTSEAEWSRPFLAGVELSSRRGGRSMLMSCFGFRMNKY